MMLLVAIVTGAQAADFSAPATKKYGDITFLDVAATDANVTVGNDNYLTYGAYYIGVTLEVTTWYNVTDSKPAGNKEDGIVGDFSGQGFIEVTATTQDDTNGNGGLKFNNSRIRYYYVTGATSVAGLVKDNGEKKYTQLQIQEVAADGTLGTATTIDGNKSTSQYVINGGDLDASKYYKISFTSNDKSNCVIYQVRFGKAPSKTVATQAFAGVKQGDATLTENTDYTVDGTTITLTDAATSAPSDISLINHVTYTDESEEDTDVAVEFGETASEGYFSGSVTIGLTTYTVKVPQDDTPTLEASETALSVTSVKVGTGTATFTLTGANLAGESVSVAFASAVEGLTVSPASIEIASGAVNQEVTVSYQSNEDVDAAVVNLVVSTTGVSDITIPVTYSSTAPVIYSQVDVTEAATWNWANYGTNEIKLTDATTPSKSTEFLLANIENYGYNAPASTFGNAQQLLMTTEYVVRDGKYWQGGSIKFNTTVPGKITVVYSNTGNRTDEAQRRFLNVNGINYGVGTMTSKSTTTTTVSVAAGEVAITGKFGPSVEDQADQYLRINSITFTPTTTETVTIPTEGVATYVTKSALDFSTVNGTIKAYAVTGVSETSATTAEVGAVPAGTPLLIKGAEGDYDIEIVESASPVNNLLKISTGTVTGEAGNVYAYSKSALKFKKVAETVKVPAGKCYLQIDGNGGDALDIIFEGEATAIENVNANDNANANSAAPVKVIKNGKLYIGNFNVAGQQVK